MSETKTTAGKGRVPVDEDVLDDLRAIARRRQTRIYQLVDKWLRAAIARCRIRGD